MVADFDTKLIGKAGDQSVAFIRVALDSASTSKSGPKTGAIPNFGACKGAWKCPSANW